MAGDDPFQTLRKFQIYASEVPAAPKREHKKNKLLDIRHGSAANLVELGSSRPSILQSASWGRSMQARIEVSNAPSKEEMDAIMVGLLEFNAAHGCPADNEPLSILLKDEEDRIIGGLWGRTGYEWLFVEHLVVPGKLRGHDLGTALMSRAEGIAKERGCVGAWLTTQTFHSPSFYEKLGYEVVGVLEGNPRPHNRIIFRKYFPER